ncbi:hypothetical protein PITCH_A920029 [uncultured Desulfobacterium sp.]|uniref:Uncharacterized protein n=1 Tax=uncultured Desulfobacterium sp. TaxID=201089 RepID=A0A445N3Z0_9BACT|nr:hypothetical protein PITCH_A920029 [uncultured Desulfobacterium sp.]
MIVDLKSTPHKTPRLIVEGGLVNLAPIFIEVPTFTHFKN